MNAYAVRSAFFFASLLLLGSASHAAPPALGHASDDVCRSAPSTTVSSSTRQALQALSSDDQQRINILEHYLTLHAAMDTGRRTAADKVAANRARLVVAASYLQQQRFEQARQLLAGIELDSPVAVQASLLLAESWRLQGDQRQAAQWMLRTGQRYGADPQALTSLLSHASELRQHGASREAFALYNVVQNQILDNSRQVAALRDEMDQLAERLLRARLDESREAHSQLLKLIIHETDGSVMRDLGQLAANGRTLRCLNQQQKQLAERAFENSAQQVRIKPFLTMLKREQAMLQQRLAQLADDSRPEALAEQNEIRQQLEAARAQKQKLLAQQQQLPDEANRQHDQLAARIDALTEQNALLHDAIRAQLQRYNEQLLAQYRELAAESQYGRASLLHERQQGG